MVDLKWRLDYSLQSRVAGRIYEPFYFLTLKVKDSNDQLHDIEMIASLEELQEMLAKVRHIKRYLYHIQFCEFRRTTTHIRSRIDFLK